MKVALIGNMNNNFFVMMRYFLDRNIDCDLYILETDPAHFLPENDSASMELMRKRIKYLNWGSRKSFLLGYYKKGIKSIRKEYDVVFGCGRVPAYFQKSGCSLDVFVPYGADLYSFPFPDNRFSIKALIENFIARYQADGIKNSSVRILTNIFKPQYDAFEKLGSSYIPLRLLHVYTSNLGQIDAEKEFREKIDQIRNECDLLVVNNSRHVWKTYVDQASSKGNNLLIEGFADFIIKSTVNGKLVLFEYGPDVSASKALISKLKIENHVIWFPVVARKNILYLIKNADFTSDQFISGDVGSSTWEGMAIGKPVFTYFSIAKEDYPTLQLGRPFPPVLNVSKPDEITTHLFNFIENSQYYIQLGIDAKKWYKAYMADGLVNKYIKILECLNDKEQIEEKNLIFDL